MPHRWPHALWSGPMALHQRMRPPLGCRAELRRHKRTFLKLATKMAYSRIAHAATAQRLFVDYLATQQQH